MSNDDYEIESSKIREENKKLLSEFSSWLSNSGLKEKTIRKHSQNIDLYINHFLLYDDCIPAKDGISSVNSFFNWYFPRKAMWSSITSTKENVASLKKFYKFLSEHGKIDIIDYHFLLNTIKKEVHDWQSHYNEGYEEYEW